jgi:hypothetical protein
MIRLFKNIPYKLELAVTNTDGDFVSGLSITYEVKKCSDDSIVSSGTMSEINSVYTKEITLTEVGEYRVKYTTPSTYDNGFETLFVDEYANYKADVSTLASQASVDLIKIETDKIKYILGLSQENYRLFNIIYTNNLITSTTIKIYPTATDCENDTNSLAAYNVVAAYDLDGKLTSYKVKKV